MSELIERVQSAYAKREAGKGYVDYSRKIVLPIRDMHRDGRVYCEVIVYGYTLSEAATIPGGARPWEKAVARLGLDPDRYQAVFFDLVEVQAKTDWYAHKPRRR